MSMPSNAMIDGLDAIFLSTLNERDVDRVLIGFHEALKRHVRSIDRTSGKCKVDTLLLEYMHAFRLLERFYDREVIKRAGISRDASKEENDTERCDTIESFVETVLLSGPRDFKIAASKIQYIMFVATRKFPELHSTNDYNAIQTRLDEMKHYFTILENHAEHVARSCGMDP